MDELPYDKPKWQRQPWDREFEKLQSPCYLQCSKVRLASGLGIVIDDRLG